MKHCVVGVYLLFAATLCLAEPSDAAKGSENKTSENVAPSANANGNTLIGDADRGRLVFGSCRTCHLPDKGAGNHNGPNLYAVFGRKAGTREGFLYYSDSLKKADFVWTPELLDLWLANPGTFLPDSAMIFVGIKDPQRRADLIEYLKTFHD